MGDTDLRRTMLLRLRAAARATALACLAMATDAAHATAGTQTQLPTTLQDFFAPGTQDNSLELLWPQSCRVCHEYEDKFDGNKADLVSPYFNWNTSMMAQSARDPIWHAALAIANQDADFGGATCIRCHSPNAYLGGHSVPTDGSAFDAGDFEGISCNFCHRMVDPVASPNNPPEDSPILKALAAEGLLPVHPGNAQYVVDPNDVRRGPLDDVPANYHGVPIIVSPYHASSNLCGTCHDVSNPVYTRQKNGSYSLNAFNAAHPSGNPHDMMPEQRTYSEWKNSAFAGKGVYFPDKRFGGNHPTFVMQSCQDCHMPRIEGGLCIFWDQFPFFSRPDIGQHGFAGSNSWVIQAIYNVYGQSETGMNQDRVDLALQRVEQMLQNASDMQLVQLGNQLKVRIINYSGHKLPTGYPEGRRMWINVTFFDAQGELVAERGAYDYKTADLNTGDTKVYEAKFGLDSAAAAATNLPKGESFHLLLNNVLLKDNRIPPIGFTNAAFAAVQAAPVAHTYADGQYWDDTLYPIPPGATQVSVSLNYQTTTKEYIEFLRDANFTNEAGQIAYDLWESHGKSQPVNMDAAFIQLAPPRLGDANHDGVVNIDDLLAVINGWGPCPPPNICPSDVTGNGVTNVDDLLLVINNWG